MPRKARGTTFVSDGSIYASVAIAPKKRLARALPFLRVAEHAAARDWAATLQELVDALRAASRDGEIAAKVDVAIQVGIDDRKGALARVRSGVAKLRADDAPKTLVAAPRSKLTVRAFGERWTKGDLHAEYPDHVPKKKSAKKDRQILERWVYPVVEHVALSRSRSATRRK